MKDCTHTQKQTAKEDNYSGYYVSLAHGEQDTKGVFLNVSNNRMFKEQVRKEHRNCQ